MAEPATEMLSDCPFPKVLPNCTANFKDVLGTTYFGWRVGFIAMGIFACALNGYQMCRVFQLQARLQKYVYTLTLVSSVSFLLRGVDPFGYGDLMPSWVVNSATAVSIGSLYTISYVIILVWLALARKFSSNDWRYATALRAVGITLLVLTWVDVVGIAILATGDPEYLNTKPLGIFHLIFCILAAMCVAYTLYSGIILDKKLHSALNHAKHARGDIGTPPARSLGVQRYIGPDTTSPATNKKASNHVNSISIWTRIKETSKILRIVGVLVILGMSIVALEIFQTYTLLGTSDFGDFVGWAGFTQCLREGRSSCAYLAKIEFPVADVIEFIYLIICSWVFWNIPEKSEIDDDDEDEDGQKFVAETEAEFLRGNQVLADQFPGGPSSHHSKRSSQKKKKNSKQPATISEYFPTEILISEDDDDEDTQYQPPSRIL